MMIAVFGSIIPSLAKVSLSDLGTMHSRQSFCSPQR